MNPLKSAWLPLQPKNRQFLFLLLPIFVMAFALLVAIFYQKAEAFAVDEARKDALSFLLSHKAVHRYVVETQRPEIYRLQESGQLYKEYFSPKVMSFTYIARNIMGRLNEERGKAGLPTIYFKLAADNPRNPVNQADPFESALLARMNRGEVKEISEVVQQDGASMLHVALPIDRSSQACLKCHGDPQDAPAELLAQYGDQAGFHESPNSIRALISLRVPLTQPIQTAHAFATMLAALSAAILMALYGLIHFFVLRLDRKQQEIQQAKEFAEKLVLTSNALVLELDLEGRVKLINPALEQISGYTAAELLGKDWFETLVPRERYPAVWKMFQELPTAGIVRHFENPILSKTGEEHYIIWQNSLLTEDERIVGIISVGIDMTQNRQISKRLAEQDAMLRQAQHVAHIGTWRLDHAQRTMAWSDEMFNIFDIPFSPLEVPTDAMEAAIHPADRERVRNALGNSCGAPYHYDLTYRLLLPDGVEKYVHEHGETECDETGVPVVTLGVSQDVTEQILTEMSVRESEVRFRTIAEFTYDWEYWQGLQGEILYINPACERISGYTPIEFITRPSLLSDIVHPEDQHLFADHHEEILRESVSSLEFRIITKAGEVRWLWHGCRAVHGPNHEPLGRRASNRDITDRKLAEIELQRYRQQLEHMVEERTAALSIAKASPSA